MSKPTLEQIHRDLAALYRANGLDAMCQVPAEKLAELTTTFLGCIRQGVEAKTEIPKP